MKPTVTPNNLKASCTVMVNVKDEGVYVTTNPIYDILVLVVIIVSFAAGYIAGVSNKEDEKGSGND